MQLVILLYHYTGASKVIKDVWIKALVYTAMTWHSRLTTVYYAYVTIHTKSPYVFQSVFCSSAEPLVNDFLSISLPSKKKLFCLKCFVEKVERTDQSKSCRKLQKNENANAYGKHFLFPASICSLLWLLPKFYFPFSEKPPKTRLIFEIFSCAARKISATPLNRRHCHCDLFVYGKMMHGVSILRCPQPS